MILYRLVKDERLESAYLYRLTSCFLRSANINKNIYDRHYLWTYNRTFCLFGHILFFLWIFHEYLFNIFALVQQYNKEKSGRKSLTLSLKSPKEELHKAKFR